MSGGIDVKMGVTGVANFQQAMNTAQRNVKSLDAALKLNEKQLQATGDKETYMANKADLLRKQIAEQTTIIQKGQQALAAMEKQGVSPAAASYQKLQQQVLNAQAALIDMNSGLDNVGQSAQETTQKTDKLTSSLNSINKKVSFDAVLSGIGKITDGMEAAARRVEALARDVWSTIADAAAWGDNQTTLAAMYGLDTVTLQQMQYAALKAETTVDAIIKSQQKLKYNITYNEAAFEEARKKLGVSLWDGSGAVLRKKEFEDLFWEMGEALKGYGDEIERDAMAQKIFGRGWMDLMILFRDGRAKFNENMEQAPTVSEENVDKLNELSSTIENVQQQFETLKNSAFAQLAPAFNEVGKSVSEMLGKFNEYLQTEEGKEKLSELSEAVTELFSGLSDVDFGQALDTAKGILDGIVGALTWIKDNHTLVEGAIKGIGGAFVALKVAEVLGTLMQGVAALKGLIGKGAEDASASAAGGAAAGGAAAGGNESAASSGGLWQWLTESAKNVLGTDVPRWLYGLSLGALFKTGEELDGQLPGTWGWLNSKKQQFQKVSVAGYVDPETGNVYSVEEWNAMQGTASQPVGDPKRPKNITGTASAESMQGYVERTVEDIYDELYKAINEYDPETNIQEKTLFFENVLKPLAAKAMQAGNVPLEEMDEIAALFKKKFLDSFEDDWEGTTGGLLNILQEAIDEKAQGLTVETEPVLPEDTVSKLQETLNSYDLYLRVTPIIGNIDAMVSGVRGASGGTSKSYTNTSNVYFGNVNVNNGTDLNGMAAKIAEQTKQAMAGFGG